jgi:hypothetical protein
MSYPILISFPHPKKAAIVTWNLDAIVLLFSNSYYNVIVYKDYDVIITTWLIITT